MKHYLSLGLLILSVLLFTSCANRGNPFPSADLTAENWQQLVESDSHHWGVGADRWFWSGEPNRAEVASEAAPDSAAISTMSVRVADFSNVSVNGPFQVQIFGSMDRNSVYVYGPNTDVRQVVIEVRGNTLHVDVSKDAASSRYMGQVIVRIGIMNLNNLVQKGSGRVEVRQIQSRSLNIYSSGSGNIYLAGNVNLKCITQSGSGSVSVWGAVTPVLDIETTGSGCVNVTGNVGIRLINHHGKSDVNIIGANSDSLIIRTSGYGKIGIRGIVNVRDVVAKGSTCVYICSSISTNLNAYLYDRSRLGVAGRTNDLYVYAAGSSRFWGRNLCVLNAYVRAEGRAHINVMATNKIFASATGNSSVYFFGTPDLMSQFVSGNGTVIPVWFDNKRVCIAQGLPLYKDMNTSVQPRHKQRSYHWKNKHLVNPRGEG